MNKRKVGEQFETQAVNYLVDQGFRIVDRNWHAGKLGELDIVAKDGDCTFA